MELPARTTRRTVGHMFNRKRSTADRRQLSAISDAFHDRLVGALVASRTDPPRVEPRELRARLGGAASGGLRKRLDGRLNPT